MCVGVDPLLEEYLITDQPSYQEEEVDQFYDSSGIAWKLTLKEAQAVAGLRI